MKYNIDNYANNVTIGSPDIQAIHLIYMACLSSPGS